MTPDVSITDFIDEDKGIVLVEVTVEPSCLRQVTVVASAKCDQLDTFDAEVGLDLAMGRAFRKLGKEFLNQAHSEIHRRDKVRARALTTQAEAKAAAKAAKEEALKAAEESDLKAATKGKAGAKKASVKKEKS